MSYKTILVHLTDKRHVEGVLGPAIHLARRNNAHLIGLHVYANAWHSEADVQFWLCLMPTASATSDATW